MTDEKQNKVASFLAGIGIPANWAKVLAGAIVGAITAIMALSQTSCTNVDVSSDEAVLEGEKGKLEVTADRLTWTQNAPRSTTIDNIKPVK